MAMVFCHASVIRSAGSSNGHIGLRLAMFMSILLLCAGIESNPGPVKYDDLANKMDALFEELKSLRKDTNDRLDVLKNEMSTRLSVCEKSFVDLRGDVHHLSAESADNSLASAIVAMDLSALVTRVDSLSPIGLTTVAMNASTVTISAAPILSSSPSMLSLEEMMAEFKRREVKKAKYRYYRYTGSFW